MMVSAISKYIEGNASHDKRFSFLLKQIARKERNKSLEYIDLYIFDSLKLSGTGRDSAR